MSRTSDADAMVKEAKKLGTKTLFKRNPDYDGAAVLFDKAAAMYRAAKAFDSAKVAYVEAADAHYKANNIYLAGKSLETCSTMLKDNKKIEEAVKVMERAGMMYREDGKPDKAGEVIGKAASLSEDPEKKAALFLEALDIFNSEEKYHYAGNTYRNAVAFLTKAEMWDRAIQVLKGQVAGFRALDQEHNVHKSFLSVVAIELRRDNWPAADEAYNTFASEDGFTVSEEGRYAFELLMAYANRDPEAFKKLTTDPSKLGFFDNEVGRMARNIKMNPSGPKYSSKFSLVGGDHEEVDELEALDEELHAKASLQPQPVMDSAPQQIEDDIDDDNIM